MPPSRRAPTTPSARPPRKKAQLKKSPSPKSIDDNLEAEHAASLLAEVMIGTPRFGKTSLAPAAETTPPSDAAPAGALPVAPPPDVSATSAAPSAEASKAAPASEAAPVDESELLEVQAPTLSSMASHQIPCFRPAPLQV